MMKKTEFTTEQEDIVQDWQQRGFSCDIWTDPPGQIWEDFKHDMDELFMLLEGQVELEIGGQSLRPALGQELLIPENTLHSVRNTGRGASRWLFGYKVDEYQG